MRAHTSTTQVRVGGRGRMKRRIVPGGILALSLAVVLLAATASTASAERGVGTWNCAPLPPAPPRPLDDPQITSCFGGPLESFDFGYHKRGTSAAQRFALGVYDNDTFSPRIGVSGDYAQTNNCPPTLSAPNERVQGCLIDVTFTPMGKGFRGGTLTTGPGGPTVALTGTTDPGHLRLSGRKKQSLRQGPPTRGCLEHGRCPSSVQVKASCGDAGYPADAQGGLDDLCTARVKGKLTKVKKDKLKPVRRLASTDLAPGETETLALKLTKKTGRQVRKALDEGEKVEAKVTVRGRDAAGDVQTAKSTIRLVK
jgi:hypothetical protein